MNKSGTTYVCQNCGAQSPKWIGRCPSCGEWNTYMEEVVVKRKKITPARSLKDSREPVRISGIPSSGNDRIPTRMEEFDRILGGGLVPGSLVLIGGEPGIGKSTIALQLALGMKDLKTLYVSGEESNQQIRIRADRTGHLHDNCYILCETDLEGVIHHIKKLGPDLLIIDSIQTLSTDTVDSFAGSISQIRECTARIQEICKGSSLPAILIGHINKEGHLAGPKVLEHVVDTVLQFEGDRHYIYRILRAIKNRFGSTSDLGIFEMRGNGLAGVKNPSEILISDHDEALNGIAIAASLEGIRPFLIEVQALVSTAAYGTPQRSTTGFDVRRLGMLLAVLEKRAGFRMATKDVFLNIAGGIRVSDPAIDLAVVASVLSSAREVPIGRKTCFAAEVGLSGEIRPVPGTDRRIAEAERLGFERIFISRHGKSVQKPGTIEVIPSGNTGDIVRQLFRKIHKPSRGHAGKT